MEITIYGSRLVAILIIEDEVYTSDCDHQECLHEYRKRKELPSTFDDSSCDEEELQKIAIKETYSMKESHEIYGFDVFDEMSLGYMLLAHDKETYNDNKKWAKKYAKENNCKLGYFIEGYLACIIE